MTDAFSWCNPSIFNRGLRKAFAVFSAIESYWCPLLPLTPEVGCPILEEVCGNGKLSPVMLC